MNNYAVFLEGLNFELQAEGSSEPELLGFFTTMRVQAVLEAEAARAARKIVERDPQFSAASKGRYGTSPRVTVKVVHQLLPENTMANTSYTFFPMKEE